MWGKHGENGVWLAKAARLRLRTPWRGHDSFYLAAWRFRVRITAESVRMLPSSPTAHVHRDGIGSGRWRRTVGLMKESSR